MSDVRTVFSIVLLLGVLALAFCNGCAAVPPPAPKWSDRVPATAAVYLEGEGWACSGVAVGDHQVMTARHCVCSVEEGTSRGPFVVTAFPGVNHNAVSAQVDERLDVALVTVDGPRLEVQAPIAPELPDAGDLVFLAAFGCYRSLMVSPGLYIGKAPDGDVAFAGVVCSGDSGGPVFNERGEVFGILSKRGTTAAVGFAVDVRHW